MSIASRIAAAFRGKETPAAGATTGRNEPCWCGSGRKYKRCHLEKDRLRQQAQSRSCVST